MSAILKWLLSFLLDYLWARIQPAIQKLMDKFKRSQAQKESLDKLKEVQNAPNSTEKDENKATDNWLNS